MGEMITTNDQINEESSQIYDQFDKMLKRHPKRPHLINFKDYREIHQESISDPTKFWSREARELLTWVRDFETTRSGSFTHGDLAWFVEGQLNASYNCVDRHAFKNPDRTAIIYEADEVGGGRKMSYGELLREVSKTSWALREAGIQKGDTVAIYMPMIPEALIAILATIRIGAVHSAIFAGFSAEALRGRVIDAQSKVIITVDESRRGGKIIPMKKIVDDALVGCSTVTRVLVCQHTCSAVPMIPGRDLWWHEETAKWPAYITPEPMGAEDPLFLLYTSGSTGKPKGLMHTTAGYLLGAAITGKYVFDIHDGDCFFCTGDVGWITGHTYAIYAPLLLGISTVVYEGTPTYPTTSRYWDIIEKYNVTHFHTAPTALRLLKRLGDEHIGQNMNHLRILGCVGEPIAAEVWKWYHGVVGNNEAHVLDTYFQTETGSNVMTPLGGITPTKPGSATFPFFGIEPVILNALTGQEISEHDREGVLAFKQPWPSMARTIYGDHKRFVDTYLNVYDGYYFTGDRASRNRDGFFWILGRVDDVINVSGHRLSTAEIEAALIEHHAISEAAVVGATDELTGQAVNAYVCLKQNIIISDELYKSFINQVRKVIGPFAAPKIIYIVPDLPKTRSGKIMRRVLRKIIAGEESQLGDTSTLVNPSCIEGIIEIVNRR